MDWLSIKEFIKDTIKYVILVVIVFVVAVYVVGLQQVVGPSMQPTLNNGAVIILNKISYKFTNIKRGLFSPLFLIYFWSISLTFSTCCFF